MYGIYRRNVWCCCVFVQTGSGLFQSLHWLPRTHLCPVHQHDKTTYPSISSKPLQCLEFPSPPNEPWVTRVFDGLDPHEISAGRIQ